MKKIAILILLLTLGCRPPAPFSHRPGPQIPCKVTKLWEEPGNHSKFCPTDCDTAHMEHYVRIRAADGRVWEKIWISEEEYYSKRWNSNKTFGFAQTCIKGD